MILVEAGRWLILLALIFSPWWYGGVILSAQYILAYFCFIAAAFVYLGRFMQKERFPQIPFIPFLILLFLLLEGWGMTLNAAFALDTNTYHLFPLAQKLRGPGSFDRAASLHSMFMLSAFAGAFCIVADSSCDAIWRWRWIKVLTLNGLAVCLFGLIEKMTHVVWSEYGQNIWPFASFYYHGNAGAFINLIIPVTAAAIWYAFLGEKNRFWQSIAILAFVVSTAAAFVNASKASIVVAGMVLTLLFVAISLSIRKMRIAPSWIGGCFLIAIVLGVSVVFLAQTSGIQTTWMRWNQAWLAGEQIAVGRRQVAQICLNMGSEAGIFGFGPGVFASLFPYAARVYPPAPGGVWQHAHEDYLQTLIEWGWLGAILWFILLWGGVAVSCFYGLAYHHQLRKRSKFLLLCVAISLAGCLFHALVDFPLQIPSLQLTVSILLGLAWGSLRWPRLYKADEKRE